jgi:hypothetical protein
MLCLLSRRPGEKEFAISFPAEAQPIRSDYQPASKLSRPIPRPLVRFAAPHSHLSFVGFVRNFGRAPVAG